MKDETQEKITIEDLTIYLKVAKVGYSFLIVRPKNIRENEKKVLLKELKSDAKKVGSICTKYLEDSYLSLIDPKLKDELKNEDKKNKFIKETLKIDCGKEYLLEYETEDGLKEWEIEKKISKNKELKERILANKKIKDKLESVSYAFIKKPSPRTPEELLDKAKEIKGIIIGWYVPDNKKIDELNSSLYKKYKLTKIKKEVLETLYSYELQNKPQNLKLELWKIINNIIEDEDFAPYIYHIGLYIEYIEQEDCDLARKIAERLRKAFPVIKGNKQ